jgi:hypothetical protein
MGVALAKIPYEEVQFYYISDHYDWHLNGLCIYEKNICEFKLEYPDWNEELDEYEPAFVDIYKLSWLEKIKWLKGKWIFEIMVGYHWSYSRKTGERISQSFHYRKPKILYVFLFNRFFKLKKKKSNGK